MLTRSVRRAVANLDYPGPRDRDFLSSCSTQEIEQEEQSGHDASSAVGRRIRRLNFSTFQHSGPVGNSRRSGQISGKSTNSEPDAIKAPRDRYNKPGVGILTLPVAKTGVIPLRNLAEVVKSVADQVYVVTGGDGYHSLEGSPAFRVVNVDHRMSTHTSITLLQHVIQELRLCGAVLRVGRNVDVWIFFIGGEATPLPILAARLLGVDT